MSGLALFFLLILAGFAVVLPVLFMARPLKVPKGDGIKVDNVTSMTGDIKIIDRTGKGVSVRNAKAPGNIVAISTSRDDDPVLDPSNPLSPFSPLNQANQMTTDGHTSSNHSHSQPSSHSGYNHDTSSSHHSSSSHDYSSSHSSHDYGSSYGGDSYGGGHDHGGGGDFGGGHHD